MGKTVEVEQRAASDLEESLRDVGRLADVLRELLNLSDLTEEARINLRKLCSHLQSLAKAEYDD